MNVFFVQAIVLNRLTEGRSSISLLRGWEVSADTQRALRRIARLESSERDGTVRPMILDAVLEILSSLFFSETEREG